MNKFMRLMVSALAVVLAVVLMPISYMATAGTPPENSFIVENGVITGITPEGEQYLSTDKNPVIQGTINGETITGIGNSVFRDVPLDSVTLPATVVTIGDYAFYQSGLNDINLENVETTGSNALQLNNLSNVDLSNVTTLGESVFAQNDITNITFSSNLTAIPKDAFRDNAIDTLDLSTTSITVIEQNAFSNNLITELVLPNGITTIGDGAFSVNSIREVVIPDSIETLGNEVFAKNNGWVKLVTESTVPQSANYTDGWGQVVNPLVVTFNYVDESGTKLLESETLGSDLSSDNVFFAGENTIVPPTIPNYKPLSDPFLFTLTEDGQSVDVVYEKVDYTPTINAPNRSFDANATVDESVLLDGVSATSFDGVDISNKVTVSPNSIDTSISGVHEVYYSVTDDNGNSNTIKRTVAVGVDYGKIEVGGGWLVEDFTYSGTTVTGFSPSGQAKLDAGNTVLYIPAINMDGDEVTIIGDNSFNRKNLTGIGGSWQNIKTIGAYSFEINKLDSIPESWGNITTIGRSAFNQNQLTSLPDDWGNITTIGDYAFYQNQLTSLPDDWGNITSLGNYAFYQNQLTGVPDDWGNITSLGSYAFAINQLTSLPDDWGNITTIRENAFYQNQLTGVPDDWGNITTIGRSAFYGNQLTSLPDDWGNITTIGDYAFYQSQLTAIPDDWGNITSLGSGVFHSNQLTSLPDDWGDITTIGESVFHSNQLTSLPDDWGNITSLGYDVFVRNQLTSLPDDWGNITSLGNYAFYKNQLTGVPDDWGNITSLGFGVFDSNQLTNLPDDWGNITVIPDFAFRGNKIKEIPDDWGNITRLGYDVFVRNQLTSLPDDWGNITTIGGGAFHSNQLTSLPDDWGNITSLGSTAFHSNQLTSLPDDWGNITTIGDYAFFSNQIEKLPDDLGKVQLFGANTFTGTNNVPRDQEFTLPDANLTQALVDNLTKTAIWSSDPNRMVILRTHDGTNPNNIANTNIVKINPVVVTLHYVDTNGNRIAPSSVYYSNGELSREFQPAVLYGYTAPEPVTITYDSVTMEYTFVYEEQDAPTAEANNRGVLELRNPDRNYHIGNDLMLLNTRLDLTGYDTGVEAGSYVEYRYDPDVYDMSKIRVPNASNFSKFDRWEIVQPGVARLYLKAIDPGTSVTYPINWMFNKYVTPSKTEHEIMATWIANDTPVATSDTVEFHGYYQQPYMRVAVNNSIDNGLRAGVDFDAEGNVAAEGNTTVTYDYRVYNLQRNVDSFIVTAPLPKYVKTDGTEGLAVFDPELNTGWSLQADGETLIYEGTRPDTIGNFSIPLVLGFPSALKDSNIVSTANIELFPTNQSETEPTMLITDDIVTYFHVIPKPVGIFTKNVIKNDKVYDNPLGRNSVVSWELNTYNRTDTTHKNVVITDHTLDPRMYITDFASQSDIGEGKLEVWDADGDIIGTYTIGTEISEITRVPEAIGRAADRITITYDKPLSPEDQVYTIMNTKFRDTETSLFDYEYASDLNTVYNYATYSSDISNITDHDAAALMRADQTITATKKSYFDSFMTNSDGFYDVGFKTSVDYGDHMDNFVQVDFIPEGFTVTGYNGTNLFNSFVNPKIQKVDNYNNTGYTAIVWTADRIPYTSLSPDKEFTIGRVNGYVNFKQADINMLNDTFLKADGTLLGNPTVDPRLDTEEWSKASVVDTIGIVKEMTQRKAIRTVGGEWVNAIQTYPGESFDYRLTLENGTDNNRENIVAYDVLPAVGDLGIGDIDNQLPRNSMFANSYDTTREITLPEGYSIQYYNSDSPVLGYNGANADDVLSGLEWSDAPAENTKAIRIIQNDGVVLAPRTGVDFIIPMKANNETNGIDGVPLHLNERAYNTFFYKDSTQTRLIEGNRVHNKMITRPTDISFTKISQDNNQRPLAGATFEYQREDGTLVARAVSGTNGVVTFTQISPQIGDKIVETAAPEGYLVNEAAIIVTKELLEQIMLGNSLDNFMNFTAPVPKEYPNVELLKTDANNNPLPGATFTLKKSEVIDGVTVTKQYTATSDANGRVFFKFVETGRYYLTEVTAPGVLEPIAPRWVVVSSSSGETQNIGTFVNNKARVTLYKLGIAGEEYTKEIGEYQAVDGSLLSGASFKLIDSRGTERIVNVNSMSTLTNLNVNEVYTLIETKAPADYTVYPEPMKFTITPTGQIADENGNPFTIQSGLYVPNLKEYKTSMINILKTGGGTPLEGAEFQLEKKNADGVYEYYASGTSDTNGVVSFDNLLFGTYRVSETNAPEGYARTFETREFTLQKYASNTYTWDVNNKPLSLQAYKAEYVARGLSQLSAEALVAKLGYGVVKQNGVSYDVVKPLAGATFELRDMNGNVLETANSNESGIAAFSRVINDTDKYQIVETVAPEGYVLSNTVYNIDVETYARMPSFTGTIERIVPNNPETGRVVVSKIDSKDGSTLAGAVFQLENVRTGETRTITTPDTGLLVVDRLNYGDYRLTEIEAPTGYAIDTTVREFTVNANQTSHTYIIPNMQQGDVEVYVYYSISGEPCNTAGEGCIPVSGIGGNVNGDDYTTDSSGHFKAELTTERSQTVNVEDIDWAETVSVTLDGEDQNKVVPEAVETHYRGTRTIVITLTNPDTDVEVPNAMVISAGV